MEVYQCGTECTIKLLNAQAIIVGVSIRYERVMYECSYFVNQVVHEVWLHETSLVFKEYENKTQIGFKV